MKYNDVWLVTKSCLKLIGSNLISVLRSFNEVLVPFPVSFTPVAPLSDLTEQEYYDFQLTLYTDFAIRIFSRCQVWRFEIEAWSRVSDGVKLICESAKCLCVCQGRRQLCAGVCGDLWYAAGSHVQVQRTEVTERGVCVSQSHDPAQLQWVFFSLKVWWNVHAFLLLVITKTNVFFFILEKKKWICMFDFPHRTDKSQWISV